MRAILEHLRICIFNYSFKVCLVVSGCAVDLCIQLNILKIKRERPMLGPPLDLTTTFFVIFRRTKKDEKGRKKTKKTN